VVIANSRREFVEETAATRRPCCNADAAQFAGLEPQCAQIGHFHAQGRRPFGQRRGASTHWIGLEVEGVELGQPSRAVRGEDRIGRPGPGQDLVALENDLVLEGVEGDTVTLQRVAHGFVARHRLGLVIVVGKHRLGRQLAGQPRQLIYRNRMAHDQSRAGQTGPLAQVPVEFQQRFANELDPPVAAWQRQEDGGIENEDAVDLAARLERVEQGGVVMGPQVPAKPHQAGVVRRFHNMQM